MNLRNQISLTLLGVFGLLTAANMLVQTFVSAPSYERLENQLARSDADRVEAGIRREVDALDKFALEWAVWDDAYNWVGEEGPNEAFVKSNLAAEDYYQQSHTPVFIFADADGKVLFSSIKNPTTYENESVPEFSIAQLEPGSLLFPGADAPDVSGIIITSRGPTLVVSRRVVPTSDDKPSHGRFIAARYLNEETVNALREQVGVQFSLVTGAGAAGLPAAEAVLAPTRDGGTLEVSKSLACLTPGAELAAVSLVPRAVTAEGFKSMGLSLIAMLVSAGAITVCLISVLGSRVVAPIQRLQAHAAKVGKSGDLTGRIELTSGNEIGALASEFNTMVARLEEAQRAMADMSRRAGMAEVASGVLHNVGNAMNSATVSVSTLSRLIADSRGASLTKLSELVSAQPDFGAFVANDPRGRQLPVFIAKLAENLGAEREDLRRECERLSHCLGHVNEIVSGHQDIARAPEASETLTLGAVIQSAVSLVKASYERHEITLTVNELPRVQGQFFRAKLQQVLVNMLTNAEQAVKPFEGERRRVELSAGVDAQGGAWVEVTDSGPGFTPEQRTKFFTQGFTTKAGGHGVGLHYCAVAMSQMKGSIDATSAGPDRGATFRIEFPIPQAIERRAAA